MLQSTPVPGPNIGEWLAIIGACVAAGGAVFKLGALTADHKNLRGEVQTALASIRQTLESINEYIAESQKLRLDWAAFRRSAEDTAATNTKDIAMLRERSHDMTEIVNVAINKSDLRHQATESTCADHEKRITTLEGDRRTTKRRAADKSP